MRLQVHWILLKLTAVITYFVLSHFPFTDDPLFLLIWWLQRASRLCTRAYGALYINTLGLSALLVFCVRFKVTQTGPSRGLPSKAETLFDTKTQRLRSSKLELGTKGSLLPSEDGLTFTIWGLKIPWNSTPKLKNATLQFCTGCASLTAVREWVCWRAFIPFLAFPSDLWTCGPVVQACHMWY